MISLMYRVYLRFETTTITAIAPDCHEEEEDEGWGSKRMRVSSSRYDSEQDTARG
jgi:hypothetical protein